MNQTQTNEASTLTRTPEMGTAPFGSDNERRLAAIWEEKPGWRGWIGNVDHKSIGIRYIITAFLFLLVGGVEALIIRVQLARPNQTLLTPGQYNQLFTMHGMTMIFLYALPVLSGFSNYLWPLMLGARDMAFPRLNAVSYWFYLFAGIFLYASFPFGEAPNAGWFNYVPLSGPEYSTGPNIDIYALGMVLLGISTTVGAANFVVTLFKMRAPGMSINRMPILVWGTLTASVANLLVIPAVSLAFFLLWLDRQFGTHFFDIAHEGRALLWQHLFWIFGHPWVYAIVLPAMGIVSDGLPTFCRRPLVGYSVVALSTMATMLVGFEVWIHHMFATGLPTLALSFFGAASMIIAIPSAVAVFAWIATIWTGRPKFEVPFYFFAGFVLLFVIGGVSGVMTAAVSLDWQLTETYFIIAHMHYVLLGINVFPVIGGIYYWFPKFTGRMTNKRLGIWGFWIMFIGFNLGFFPMHIAGLLGMPRRIYTYAPDMGWNTVNMVTSIGSFVFAAGILVFLADIFISLKRGARASANPWDAPTLEWSVPSPPPAYNFAVIPIIASRHPLWEDRLEEGTGKSSLDQGYLLMHGREALATTAMDSEPDIILKMPGDSYAPFFLALFCTLSGAGLIIHSWQCAGAMAFAAAVSLIAWMWPQESLLQRLAGGSGPHLTSPAGGRGIRGACPAGGTGTVSPLPLAGEGQGEGRQQAPDSPVTYCLTKPLPVGSISKHSTGWWGVWTLILTEGSLFGYLLLTYFYLALQTEQHWPPEGLPKLMLPGINTVILISSSVFVWASERCIRRNKIRLSLIPMAIAIVLGIAFVAIQCQGEWASKPYGIGTHLYGSLYFTITGFHMLHVVVGLVILCLLWLWTSLGYFNDKRYGAVTLGGLYWHFVDAVWLFVFSSLYLFPYLAGATGK